MTLRQLLEGYKIDVDELLDQEVGALQGPGATVQVRARMEPGDLEIEIKAQVVR